MGGKIPQNFIDDLLGRVDIVDVIDARVPLKKKGKDFMACCPFHGEKTPSFSVSQDKQFYYCFGCGASGSALGFLMDYEHMGFVEAIESLAATAGVEVPREEGDHDTPRQNYQPLYDVLEASSKFYRDQLRNHPHAQRAIDYLKGRGLSGDIVTAFGIGFAPPGWDNLIKYIGEDAAKQDSLTTSGMVIDKGDKRYDRFRDRIMIPILDRRGRCIAFGGRVLDGSSEGAKYLNSPETPIFHKGRELYGLYQARKALRDIPRLLVVEGYMDVIALAQYGIRYAVATLGTATTAEHLEQLFRTAPEVVFCFDGDRAGRAAAWRALENALPVIREGREAKFLFLPEGEDPDTFVRQHGREGLEKKIAAAKPFSTFMLENLSARADIHSIDGRAKLVELARPLFSKLGAGVYRDMLTDQLARIADMDADRLASHLFSQRAEPAAPVQRSRRQTAPTKRGSSLISRAISCLLQEPALGKLAGDSKRLLASGEPGVAFLVELLELLQAKPHLNTAAVIEHWRDTPIAQRLHELAASDATLSDAQALETEFLHTLARLDEQAARRRQMTHIENVKSKRFDELTEEEKKAFRNQLVSDS
jgi:DNA primase